MRPILFKNIYIFIQLLNLAKISGEEKIVVQYHRSATENRYTHTPHAYGSATLTSVSSDTLSSRRELGQITKEHSSWIQHADFPYHVEITKSDLGPRL